ncbi:MAG: hypothetical protein ABW124_13025 [Candidatus Thiodiazotropha sp. 6PLUC9]
MEIILAVATILGGITAIWYFWDKVRDKWFKEKTTTPRLSNAEKVRKREELRPIFEEAFLKMRSSDFKSDAIIHDVDRVDSYPNTSDEEDGISPWFRVGLLDTYHRGIKVGLRIGSLIDTDEGLRFADHKHKEKGNVKAWLVGEIPFESIESVNWEGDEYYSKPHLFCHFEHEAEPYERLVFCQERELGNGMTYFSEIADYQKVYELSQKAGVEYFA